MSATRLLILGVLRARQPIHGYVLRRELESWQAERWANIAYGSIYFALNKMAEDGLVQAVDTDQVARGPARITYAVTPAGEAEFQRLLREYWWEIKDCILVPKERHRQGCGRAASAGAARSASPGPAPLACRRSGDIDWQPAWS